MHNKKGQLAILLILAIVIVLVILLVVFIRFGNDSEIIDPTRLDVEDQMIFELQNCIDEQLGVAIQIVGLQGGYVELPDDILDTNIGPVAYGLKDGKNTVPSLSIIEKEINRYFELILPFCIDENNYPDVEIDSRFSNIRTVIGSDRVSVEAGVSLSLEKEGSSETVNEEVSSEIRVRLREMRSVAWDIANLHVRAPDFIDITYLLESDFDVLFVPIDEKLLYSITDNENKINDIEYSFLMGVE